MVLPNFAKIGICVAGIWSCYLAYGVQQEGIWLYRADGEKFTQTLVLLLVEQTISALTALAIMVICGQRSKQTYTPDMIQHGALVALAQVVAKFASNEALKYCSYVIQALAKSSKTIPAMLGSLWSGKRFSAIQWMSAGVITVGCAVFSVKGKAGGAVHASLLGVLLLLLSLISDGIVASCQEKMRGYPIPLSAYEQMFIVNFGAVVLLLPVALLSGQASSGFAFLLAHPEIMERMLLFSVCSALGQIFIFVTIVWFGPGVCAKITTVRKMATVLLSIVWFGHELSNEQWLAVAGVFAAVAAEFLEQAFCKKHGHGGGHGANCKLPNGNGAQALPSNNSQGDLVDSQLELRSVSVEGDLSAPLDPKSGSKPAKAR